MQFQVPQFIETEDKIVGPLSLRQFIFIGSGIGICGLLYFILEPWLWLILTVIIMGSAVAIAFLKIQGRPFARVVLSAFNFYWNPQTYVWQPEHPVLSRQEKEPEPKAFKNPFAAKPAVSAVDTRKKIAEGNALQRVRQDVVTGEKISAKEFTENKMYGRYQIFQKALGDRQVARRVDYR